MPSLGRRRDCWFERVARIRERNDISSLAREALRVDAGDGSGGQLDLPSRLTVGVQPTSVAPASDPKAIRSAIETRLSALSRSHDLLTRGNWQSAGLRDLIHDTLEPFAVADDRAARLVITGENVRFPPKAALALGIAFNELATNAVKYGAFSNGSGSILISWKLEQKPDGDRLLLRWQEKDGPLVTPPTRKGFGSQVLERGLAHELEGTVHLDYLPAGLICTINIPAPAVVADE
jgi:two-component sensor histidine kinase